MSKRQLEDEIAAFSDKDSEAEILANISRRKREHSEEMDNAYSDFASESEEEMEGEGEGEEEQEIDSSWSETMSKEDLGTLPLSSSVKQEIDIEPFNMKEEMRAGKFDQETGSYVQFKTEDDHLLKETLYLDNFTVEQIEKARIAKEAIENGTINNNNNNSKERSMTAKELLTMLIDLLELGESATEALVKKRPNTKKFDRKSRRMAASLEVDRKDKKENDMLDSEGERKRQIELITTACSGLLESGLYNIYDMTREELQRLNSNRQL